MTRLIVVTGFIVAFLAGVMAGVTVMPKPHGPNAPGPGGRESFLANQLGLTADQQTKMKQIWQDVSRRGGGPDGRNQRGQLRREQEEAVAKLIRPEDKTAYDKIVADFRKRVEQIDADNKKNFQQAVEKTKAILDPDQLKKYEAILAKPPGDHDRPATRPAA